MEAPRAIQVEPVGQCNLGCRMCPVQFREDGPPSGPAFMEFAHFRQIVDSLPALEELHLQGMGEPLMHPRFFEMVAYAAARGIRVTANSNLTLLTAKRAADCVESGLSHLYVSVDGATPQAYERIRVGASFARLERNLARLLEAKREREAPKPRLSLTAVIMRENLAELAGLVHFAHRWQIEEVQVQHLCHDFGESTLPSRYRSMRSFVAQQTLLQEDLEVIQRHFDRARELAAELGIALRLPRVRPRTHPPGTPGRQRCDWPWRAAYISYRGDAMPCCMIATPDRGTFGNVLAEGVPAMWTGEAYERFRARLDSDDPPEICRSCSVYSGTF